ncbi:MAG: DUF72 domain-containing protein [Desulfobacterales bacterium]
MGTSGYSLYRMGGGRIFIRTVCRPVKCCPIICRFPITELNYTWYQMPKAPAMDRMRRAAGPNFLFAAKLTRTLTHEIDPGGWPDQVRRYRDGMAPLMQSDQLAAVLMQLPPFLTDPGQIVCIWPPAGQIKRTAGGGGIPQCHMGCGAGV